ncbi:molybdopterin-containing oxidoreductase family protein [Alicyclobacillus macrosporangiidus]|uniref:Anaerobic selenocysteine-containing dehydrogenase n=1 Tax=Alicyclobacillus macrosporangiidus TaxID=392015 RepID=A0A1I7HPH1_9BACL|nr:molybdopterin-dependent oxidoreductase [Alicyclobacillus macrosporangiidus]SFU62570.1 Anaerobic selenocysteine-containing dehydrogenase [Alicyclobacillus macrosporangiidus]
MKVKTACPLDCWDTCSILAEVEDGRVVRLDGDPDHPITRGFLCTKGRRLHERLYAPHRVRQPLKKVNGRWERVTWEQALDEIADRIRDTLDHHGHHAILHAYDWGSGTLLKNLNQRFFYLLGGCTETVGSLCWEAGIEAQRYDFGQARSNAPEDLENAAAVVVWGRNVSVTNIHMMPFLKRTLAKGARLAVVNPLPTDLDTRADLLVHPRPGSDGALALGALRVCRDEGWLDVEFLSEHSVGWERLAASLDAFDLPTVAAMTDVPAETIRALAAFYGQTRPVSTLLGLGMQRYPGGGNTIRAIDALCAATGQIGLPGGGVQYANRAMSQFFDVDAMTGRSRARVREFSRGTQAQEILSADPPIRMLFVTRTNPLTQVPDTAALEKAYATIPCKVVVDQFLTRTAEMADYFLPCTHALEDEDLVYSSMWHGYVTYMHRVVAPQGDVLPDWEIFARLADRLGFGDQMRKPIDEWFRLALAPAEKHGVTLERLREEGTVRLPVPEVPWADRRFLTPSGKYEFFSATAVAEGHPGHAVYIPRQETPSAQAYSLLTIHPRLSQNSQHRDAPRLPEHPVAELPPEIADREGLQDGQLARIWNDQAELVVRVKVRPGGHPGTIRLDSGWWGQGITINHLTKAHEADFGRQTAQYDCVCSIAPLSGPAGA